jgi:hypothetical protein
LVGVVEVGFFFNIGLELVEEGDRERTGGDEGCVVSLNAGDGVGCEAANAGDGGDGATGTLDAGEGKSGGMFAGELGLAVRIDLPVLEGRPID